ncbi:hypothetical protein [Bacillus sp. EAC]|uniref:hypothetical protein n=1 Tax=Bacillus sp. EAC TaxID=1978338 RepID=UPI000B431BFB|nr:hypothetical protein [Bacillus sp. EAC]
MSFLKKIKFNKALIKFEKLEMKFKTENSRDIDLVSWPLIIDHLINGAETKEELRTVEQAVRVYKSYLQKHFPLHSYLIEKNEIEQ